MSRRNRKWARQDPRKKRGFIPISDAELAVRLLAGVPIPKPKPPQHTKSWGWYGANPLDNIRRTIRGMYIERSKVQLMKEYYGWWR